MGGEDFKNLPVETQVHLLNQRLDMNEKHLNMVQQSVAKLEKSDAITQEQLKMVFNTLDVIKEGQKNILVKLESKDKEDKEALQDTIKQNRELRYLIIGAFITSIFSVIVPVLINIKK